MSMSAPATLAFCLERFARHAFAFLQRRDTPTHVSLWGAYFQAREQTESATMIEQCSTMKHINKEVVIIRN